MYRLLLFRAWLGHTDCKLLGDTLRRSTQACVSHGKRGHLGGLPHTLDKAGTHPDKIHSTTLVCFLGMVLELFIGPRLAATTAARWKCTGHTPVPVPSGDGVALEAFFGKTFLTSPFWLALGMVFAILGPFFFPAPIAVGIRAIQAPGSNRCSGFDGLGALGTSFWRSFVLTVASQTHTCIGLRNTRPATGTPHIIGCFFTTNFFRAKLV